MTQVKGLKAELVGLENGAKVEVQYKGRHVGTLKNFRKDKNGSWTIAYVEFDCGDGRGLRTYRVLSNTVYAIKPKAEKKAERKAVKEVAEQMKADDKVQSVDDLVRAANAIKTLVDAGVDVSRLDLSKFGL